jgi:hypothetical protein
LISRGMFIRWSPRYDSVFAVLYPPRGPRAVSSAKMIILYISKV